MSQSDFVSRGQALVGAGQFQEAVKVCRLGLLGRPTTVEGRIVLGQALLALKRFDEVLAEMRVALELDPTSVQAQVLKGEALLRKGDVAAAVEALHRARQDAPGDPKILALLGQAEQVSARPPTTSHPSVSFVGSGDTKHYPNHPAGNGDEDSGGGYTKPTSLSAPGSLRRSSQRRAAAEPSAEELAVGDRSGTVEVDPELEGIEMKEDRDFADLAAPPAAGKPAAIGGARGSVKSSRPRAGKESTPTIDLDDEDDSIELGETLLPESRSVPRRGLPGPGTAVRNAVGLPSGPLDAPAPRSKPPTAPPRGKPGSVPPLAQALASRPNAVQVVPPTPAPLPPAPVSAPLPPPSGAPRLGPGLPTLAAMPAQLPPGVSPASAAAAARPTIAIAPPLSPAQQQTAAAVDAMFGGGHAWGGQGPSAASLAAANEPTARPGAIDPHMVALLGTPDSGAQVAALPMAEPPHGASPALRTGMRKERSKLQIAMWIVIGIVVIGGGVFAGLQIRELRLRKQIAAKRDQATDVAKSDTWTGWQAAAKNLDQIVGASSTAGNLAAFARARALIAFEFGDGLADAKTAVDGVNGEGGLDGQLAAAYLALAQDDARAAKTAADAALSSAADDPAALYVAGRAAELGGDTKAALTYLREAFQKDPRPLYGVGLADALAASTAWDEASATLDKVLASHPDHPAALLERARVLAAAGKIVPGDKLGMDVRGQIQKIVAEGGKAASDQPRGVSPAQVAFANLVLARVDFARGDMTTAHGDVNAAASVGLDDERFAEEAIDTLFAIGDLAPAHAAADQALTQWPQSRRARLVLAQILLASGKANDALDALGKLPDIVSDPHALSVRGEARLATGDADGARGDFEAALKKLPGLEPATVGLAWLELATGDAESARKLVEPHVSAAGAPPALATVYAEVLRVTGDSAAKEKARGMLEKVVAGPPGPDLARAQLELARLDRDLDDYSHAKAAYAEAAKLGSVDAQLESGLLLIDDHEPASGHDVIEKLLAEQGPHASATLVLEAARARMLVGDHAGAQKLLDGADKIPNMPLWKLERERGRLALRKGDFAGAAVALNKALDGCGNDAETFLLAADAATGDAKATAGLTARVAKLAPERLKDAPEAAIVRGKLLIADQKFTDAVTAFTTAKQALDKAPMRRKAQADFGLAVAKYNAGDDAEANNELQLVIEEDPSLYAAYLYRAFMLQQKQNKTALELARRAVELDPDSVDGWALAGQLAAKTGDRMTFSKALGRLGELAPDSEQYHQLAALRR